MRRTAEELFNQWYDGLVSQPAIVALLRDRLVDSPEKFTARESAELRALCRAYLEQRPLHVDVDAAMRGALLASIEQRIVAEQRAQMRTLRGGVTTGQRLSVAATQEDKKLLKKFGHDPLKAAVARTYLRTSRNTKRRWARASEEERTTLVASLQHRHRTARKRSPQKKSG